MLLRNIALLLFLLIILEFRPAFVSNDLGGVVEEDSDGAVREDVAKAIFRSVVNPLLSMDRHIVRRQGFSLLFLIFSSATR
jgi:hypothetical protein